MALLPPDAHHRSSGRPALRPAVALGPALLLLLLVPGCARSPVAEDAPRSPYERYDNLRGRDVPRTTVDSFGRERLNLEGRLKTPEAGE